MDTPNAKMRRRRDRPFRDFDALRTSSRQGGSSVGASVPMMSIETATSAPEVDVAAPGPFGLGRDRVSGPCLVSHLSTRRVSANREVRISRADALAPRPEKVRSLGTTWSRRKGPPKPLRGPGATRQSHCSGTSYFRRTGERPSADGIPTSPSARDVHGQGRSKSSAGHVPTRPLRAVTATPSDP